MKTHTKHAPRLFVATLLGLAAWTTARPAEAGLGLGADLGLTVPVGDIAMGNTSHGVGFAVRLGYKLPIPLLKLTPEVKLAYDTLPLDLATFSTYRAMVGGKAAVDLAIISPNVFLHFGYGHASGGNASGSGNAYDAGVGLDFTLLPVIDFGAFISYNRINSDATSASTNWLLFGLQAVIGF